MKNQDLNKEQLVEHVKSLQEKIIQLEEKALAQNQTEEALKTAENNLLVIFKKNTDGIVIVDTNGTVLYVNPAAEKLFGRTKANFIGYPFGFPVSSDKNISTLTIRKDESLIEVEMRIVQITWKSQLAYELEVRDITERRLAEEALKKSEEKCRVIFDHANDGMFLVDLETTKFFMCNVSCVQMLGYEQDEFLNLKVDNIHPVEDLSRINEQLGMLSKGLSGIRGEVSFKRKNGDIFIADLSSTIIQIADKNYALVIFRDITERKIADEALRESEIKYKGLYNSIRDAILVANTDRKIIDCNKAFSTLFGYAIDEIKNKETLSVYENNMQFNELGQALKEHAGNENPFLYTVNYKKKNGEIFPGETSIYYLYDSDKNITGFIGLIRDITERKQAEEEKETLLQNLNERVKELNCLYKVTKVCENDEIDFDSKIPEIVPLLPIAWKYPEITCAKIVLENIESKTKNFIETKWKQSANIIIDGTISGEVVVCYLEKKTSLDEGPFLKEERSLIEAVADQIALVTERERSRNELIKSEEKIRSILENSADAIFMTDESGSYTYTNKAVTTMLGFTWKEMLSKTIIDLAPPERINEYIEIFSKLKTEGKVFTELQLLKSDGTFISTDLNAVVLPNNMTYASCRDITERRRAENELVIAKDRAEQSDRLKTAFLQNMSHEVRTPMNGIIGFSRFLNDDNLPPEKRKQYTDIIVKSCDQLLIIITDIVSIAAIESGHEKIYEQETNINSLCNIIHLKFDRLFKDKDIEFHFQHTLADDEAVIISDPAKLTQILNNLVGNALKFTHHGFVNFGYILKDNLLEVFVEDSGIGVSLEMHDEIFKRFRQVEITEARTYGGSGLGLSISKAYVEMLGGTIWLTSEIDKGSVFYFTIPYKRAISAHISEKKDIDDSDSDFETPIILLIVEDEDYNFFLMEELFSTMNVTITRAENGLEAVEQCKSNEQIDLVLMDLKLPIMDGYEATTLIREFRPNLPIIAQTSYSTEAEKNKAIACGCSDFVSKPFTMEILLSKVREQIKKCIKS